MFLSPEEIPTKQNLRSKWKETKNLLMNLEKTAQLLFEVATEIEPLDATNRVSFFRYIMAPRDNK